MGLAAIPGRYPRARGVQLEVVHQRLAMEMKMKNIIGFGFASYFLTVADVSAMMRRNRVRNQARGSGAGSLVVYLLRVSNVDPLEHDLLFERFLGNKRSTLPDIDIDVESARRHDIYRGIFARYGDHRVTLLSMQSSVAGSSYLSSYLLHPQSRSCTAGRSSNGRCLRGAIRAHMADGLLAAGRASRRVRSTDTPG